MAMKVIPWFICPLIVFPPIMQVSNVHILSQFLVHLPCQHCSLETLNLNDTRPTGADEQDSR